MKKVISEIISIAVCVAIAFAIVHLTGILRFSTIKHISFDDHCNAQVEIHHQLTTNLLGGDEILWED